MRLTDLIIGKMMEKRAGVGDEAFADTLDSLGSTVGVPSFILPAQHLLGQVPGTIHGLATDTSDAEMDASTFKPYILPGNAISRLIRRRKNQTKKHGHKDNNVTSEAVGKYTSLLTPAAILARLVTKGKLKLDPELAVFGGLLGSAGVGLASRTLAGITLSRTQKEQDKYEQSKLRKILNYIVPGSATYNQYKSIGRLIREQHGLD